jgi:predicted NACHT family NTPase
LPEERLSLYKECSNLLLGQWDREKGIPVDDTKLTLARKETIMQEIAFALHSGRIGVEYGRKEATRQEILPIVSRLLQRFDIRDADPHALFEKLVSRSGVIVAVERYSERYAFSHLTFQEFYAAAYLFANQLDPFEATNVTAEDTSFGMTSWWSEVFPLYGAMKRQSSDIVARLIDTLSEDRYGRRLRLGAQCMAESIEVGVDVSDRLLRSLYQV